MDENYNTRFLIWVYLVSLSDRIGTKKKNYLKMEFTGKFHVVKDIDYLLILMFSFKV